MRELQPDSAGPELHLPRFSEVLPSLQRALFRFLGAGVLPVACFYIGFKTGGPLAGILAGMAASLLALGVQAVRLRRLDPIGVLPVVVIVAQGTIAVLADSTTIYLAAPAVEALVWGVVLIGSVVARRPLVPLIARELDVVPSTLTGSLGLRRSLELLTIAWGIASFAKAGVRIWLLTTLPLEAFLLAITLAVTTINVIMVALSVWLPFRMVRRVPGDAA